MATKKKAAKKPKKGGKAKTKAKSTDRRKRSITMGIASSTGGTPITAGGDG